MNVEDLQTEENGNVLPKVDELAKLKARADVMNIKYHPSISVDKLRAKIDAALDGKPDPDSAGATSTTFEGTTTAAAASLPADAVETPGQKKVRIKREASELVRINVQCMNPAKKDWDGEIFCTGNANIGTFKKFVKFNTDEGWHVPRIIYNMVKARECQIFVDRTVKVAGREQKIREGKLIREFAIEVMDPLSPKELKELAQRQLMASGTAE
jgi:hypothetical protein